MRILKSRSQSGGNERFKVWVGCFLYSMLFLSIIVFGSEFVIGFFMDLSSGGKPRFSVERLVMLFKGVLTASFLLSVCLLIYAELVYRGVLKDHSDSPD